ncbi:MAG: DUF1800 domain-containing protein [Bacteroidota bacterium]
MPEKEPGRSVAAVTPSLARYSGPWNRRAIAHLLRRAVVAPTYAEMQTASTKSMDELIDLLLTPNAASSAPHGWCGDCVSNPNVPWYDQRFDLIDAFNVELRRWWYQQMVNTNLSLQERMTLFWHNHFATNAIVLYDPRLIYFQNQILRQRALGSFRDLVRAVTTDKAMLMFLDGKYSKNNGYVNENYARELQELFTIGISDNSGTPNYTQADIREVARTLTGWDWLGYGPSGGDAASNLLTGHDPTTKKVYDRTIAGNTDGSPELEQLLDIIFNREETARYVIRKLYRFLVHTDVTLTPIYPIAPEIEENIIAPLAAEFRAANWNVSVVLRRLLTCEHFYEDDIIASTLKSPTDLLVSTVRGMRTAPMAGNAGDYVFEIMQNRAVTLGQKLFFPPGVQGWKHYRNWISTSTLPQRHLYTDQLLNGVPVTLTLRSAALFPDAVQYASGTAIIDTLAFAKQFPSFSDPEALVADIAEHLLAYAPSRKLLDRLLYELVADRAYEWKDAPDEARTIRLRAMLRYLMRSTNYQLM